MHLQENQHLPHYAIFKTHNLKIGQVARAIGRSYCFTASVLSGNMDAGRETMQRLDELVAHLEQKGGK